MGGVCGGGGRRGRKGTGTGLQGPQHSWWQGSGQGRHQLRVMETSGWRDGRMAGWAQGRVGMTRWARLCGGLRPSLRASSDSGQCLIFIYGTRVRVHVRRGLHILRTFAVLVRLARCRPRYVRSRCCVRARWIVFIMLQPGGVTEHVRRCTAGQAVLCKHPLAAGRDGCSWHGRLAAQVGPRSCLSGRAPQLRTRFLLLVATHPGGGTSSAPGTEQRDTGCHWRLCGS